MKLLKYGFEGEEVAKLQRNLNKNGANLTVDGIFGKNTESALKSYQQKNGLSVDGIAGMHTWEALEGSSGGSGSVGSTQNGYTPTAAPSGYKPTEAPTIAPTPDAPKYDTSTWDESEKGSAAGNAYNAAKEAINNYGDFVFSEQEWLDSLKNDIKNYGDFSYDVNSDALYQQYADQYMRQGKLAMADTMGQAAAMTGGYGNSYAASVGNQAYQSYLQQLNDRVPELYQLALDRYNMGKEDLYNKYGMLLQEYEREYGEYSDEYQMLLDSLGIAKDDYYSGADMFYTEQGNKNSVLGQEFNDAMAIWDANNTNAWKQAEWTESLNQYANDEAWKNAEWTESANRYANEEAWREKQWKAAQESASAGGSYSGGSSSGGSGGNTSSGSNGGTTSGISGEIKTKAASFESNDALANWAYELADSGVITDEEADALISTYMDQNEKYTDNGKGGKSLSYSQMVKSTSGWSIVDKGGVNWFWGVDNNAIVKAPNGEQIRLDNLVDYLVNEGMSKSDAKSYVKKLQKNLGM